MYCSFSDQAYICLCFPPTRTRCAAPWDGSQASSLERIGSDATCLIPLGIAEDMPEPALRAQLRRCGFRPRTKPTQT